jgi:hypothetical protein
MPPSDSVNAGRHGGLVDVTVPRPFSRSDWKTVRARLTRKPDIQHAKVIVKTEVTGLLDDAKLNPCAIHAFSVHSSPQKNC